MHTIHIKKAGKDVSVDWDSLADNVRAYIIRYGLTQSLNDVHSQITTAENDYQSKAFGLVEKRLEDFYNGIIPSGGGGQSLSPTQRAIRDIVEGIFRAQGVKAAQAKKLAKTPEESLAKAINDEDKFNQAWSKIESQAEVIVSASKLDLDISL